MFSNLQSPLRCSVLSSQTRIAPWINQLRIFLDENKHIMLCGYQGTLKTNKSPPVPILWRLFEPMHAR